MDHIPPPAQVIAEIRLEQSMIRRWGRRLLGALMVVVGLVLVFYTVGIAYGAIAAGKYPLVALALIPGLGALALLPPGLRAVRLSVATPPCIRLTESFLELEYPDHMDEPARIPRGSVAAVEIDTSSSGFVLAGHHRRFPDPQSPDRWRFSYREGSRLPVVGSTYQLPNVLITLREPFVFASARHQKDGLSSDRRWVLPGVHAGPDPKVKRLRPNRPTEGFMVTARDPMQTQMQLSDWISRARP